MFVDSHCHLSFPELHGRLDQILADMREARVAAALCICTTMEEAATVRGEFEEAWQDADVVLSSSACPCDAVEKAPAAAVGEAIDTAALVDELVAIEAKAGVHIHDAEVIVISQDAVMLLYPLASGETAQAGEEYGAALWVKRGDGWQKVLLQALPDAAE